MIDPSLDAALAELIAFHSGGGRLALLFDYDGTLTDIVARPEDARMRAETRVAMESLAVAPRVVVGILSGRALDDLRAVVDMPGLYLAGTAGLELEFPEGRRDHPRAEEARQIMAGLADALVRIVAACPGARLERKPLGLTVHFRAAEAGPAAELQARVASRLEPFAEALRILHGPMAIEIAPALEWTKATALQRITEAAGAGAIVGARPLYAGDAENDADALAAAGLLGGLSIGVGPEAPPAMFRLPGPAELTSLLIALSDKLRSPVPGHPPVQGRSAPVPPGDGVHRRV